MSEPGGVYQQQGIVEMGARYPALFLCSAGFKVPGFMYLKGTIHQPDKIPSYALICHTKRIILVTGD